MDALKKQNPLNSWDCDQAVVVIAKVAIITLPDDDDL